MWGESHGSQSSALATGESALSLSSLLFESPWTVVPGLALVEMVLLANWNRRRTRRTARIAIAGLAAIPLSVALQVLVVTEGERIARACREMASAIAAGDVAAIGHHVSDSFVVTARGGPNDKPELLDRAKATLTRWDVEEEWLRGVEVEVTGDKADVTFQSVCRLITNQGIIPRHVSRWRLRFAREGDTWKVVDVQPLRGRWMPFDSLADLLR